MNSNIIAHPPWFISMPAIVAAAVVLAVAGNVFAGIYFERTSLDDIDPFAAVEVAPASVASNTPANAEASTAVAPPMPAATPEAASPTLIAAAAGPVLLSEGTFVDGDPGHHGEGTARLIRDADGSHLLRLEDFSVTNGPDLFVVLSTDPRGSRSSAGSNDALNLGRLRATDGNINYAVPDGVDVSHVRSAVIYCRAFRVVFAVATLEGP
jgi:hypothetical protein